MSPTTTGSSMTAAASTSGNYKVPRLCFVDPPGRPDLQLSALLQRAQETDAPGHGEERNIHGSAVHPGIAGVFAVDLHRPMCMHYIYIILYTP